MNPVATLYLLAILLLVIAGIMHLVGRGPAAVLVCFAGASALTAHAWPTF